jgi:hypothetical protein
MNDVNSIACRLAIVLMVATAPAGALSQGRTVGGHIGVATPLVTVTSDDNTDISDTFTLVVPVGVTVKLSDTLAVDFETQVATPLKPKGGTSTLVVAPGVVRNFGPFAAGLRVASAIGKPANIGLIPLINRGLAQVGDATWFIEAAFPTFLHRDPDPDVTFDVVIHTGIGF